MDNCLAISIACIGVSILLTSYQSIKVELQHIIPYILGVVELHLKVLVISIANDTFFLTIRYISCISSIP